MSTGIDTLSHKMQRTAAAAIIDLALNHAGKDREKEQGRRTAGRRSRERKNRDCRRGQAESGPPKYRNKPTEQGRGSQTLRIWKNTKTAST